jgi:hypothetical protein
VIAVSAAFLVYDRLTYGQRAAVEERQREFETRTIAEVKHLDDQVGQERGHADAATRAHELELKKLELEIKRAEADQALAQLKQRELENTAAEKKRSDAATELAEQAAERTRMDAQTAREAAREQESHKKAAALRAARSERIDASRRLNDLEWKKQTAQRAVIAWKNKLEAAEHSKEKAAVDLANAQAQNSAHASPKQQDRRRYDPLGGNDPLDSGPGGTASATGNKTGRHNSGMSGPTVTWAFSNQEATAAQEQQADSEQAIATCRAALQKAQESLTRLTADYESALTAKEAADRRLALVAPAPQQNKVFATYTLLDGRKLEALCVIESGDDIWIKTGAGVQTLKRTDIEEIARADDVPLAEK